MPRIAVGGIQHETNVFGPYPATFEVFAARDEWPPLCRGERMLDEVDGMNLPITGAIDRLRGLGHEIVPMLWCSATPSAQVTEDAFERISAMFLETLQSTPVDGVRMRPMATANCYGAFAPASVHRCRLPQASTCTPTSASKWWSRPVCWNRFAVTRTSTWRRPARVPPTCSTSCCATTWRVFRPAPRGALIF